MLLILIVLVGTEAGHMAYNTSDVITTYMGHADAVPNVPEFRKSGTEKGNLRKENERIGERKGDKLRSEGKREREEKGEQDVNNSDYLEQTTAPTQAGNDNDVVFIPSGNSDAQSFSRRVGGGGDEYSVRGMMERVAVGDVINERPRVETEAPIDGVVFKPGKNNEQTEEKIKHELDDERIEQAVKEYKERYENPIDCENLDCENVLEAVCGVKLENKRPKYRLFKNECFFRKVNCGLRYEYNRYRTVPIEECDGVGSHLPPQQHTGWVQYQPPLSRNPGQDSRRSFSRRVLTSKTNGLPCDHMCPARCPDEYAPVCAYTFPQHARMFQNHCMLDLQSCSDGSVWQERALSDCAGDVRAEVHERAAFIGWMQRVGILDKKGHLIM